MKIFNILDKMHIFNSLIDTQTTGTPAEFAQRLGISRSTLYDVIDDLRSRGVSVKYSRRFRSFIYESPVLLDIRFAITHLEPLSGEDAKKITGGCKIIRSVLFSGRKECTFVP